MTFGSAPMLVGVPCVSRFLGVSERCSGADRHLDAYETVRSHCVKCFSAYGALL